MHKFYWTRYNGQILNSARRIFCLCSNRVKSRQSSRDSEWLKEGWSHWGLYTIQYIHITHCVLHKVQNSKSFKIRGVTVRHIWGHNTKNVWTFTRVQYGICDTQKNILTPSQRAKATPIYCMLWRQESFTFAHLPKCLINASIWSIYSVIRW